MNKELNQKEKIAPVQGFSAGIPWSMHLRAYDAYCKEYGSQQALIDLEGRNCRGGFSVKELDHFIPGWQYELSELSFLRNELKEMEATFDLRWKAGMRAIKRWQKEHPNKVNIWPDHADLVVWLLEQDSLLRKENAKLSKEIAIQSDVLDMQTERIKELKTIIQK